VSTFFTHSSVEGGALQEWAGRCIVYYLGKRVDCFGFDVCHRGEDLAASSIVVSRASCKCI
jgi:hypothetical protein